MVQGYPGPLSDPPAILSTQELPLISTKQPWFRLHWCMYAPLFFGRTGKTRFDDPAGEFGVLYMSADRHGAFIEVFGESRQSDGAYPGTTIIETMILAKRCLCEIKSTRSLTLVDLTGSGLVKIGADERLCAGDHRVAQLWARALWEHASRPDGLYYRARHDPSRQSVVLFDRAESVITAVSRGSLLNDPTMLAEILHEYRFTLID